MKHNALRRLLCIVLCLASVGITFVSCNQDEPDTTANSESQSQEPSSDQVVEEIICFLKSDLPKFKIVFSTGSPTKIIESAENLATLIEYKTGTKLQVTTDKIRDGSDTLCEYEYEILIGSTNRDESAAFMKNLRQNDYAYGCIGTKILIGAHDDYSLSQAITFFTTNIVYKISSDEVFFSSEMAKHEKAEYSIDSLTLNGESIAEYRIVHSADATSFTKDLALKLQLNIADLCGYVLPIVTDDVAADGTPELLIGSTARSSAPSGLNQMSGYIVGNGASVSLYGETTYGDAAAIKAFVSCMEREIRDDKTCKLDFSGSSEFKPEYDEVVAMTFNLQTTSMDDARNERIVGTILKSLPDVIGVQEANVTFMGWLPTRLSEYYHCVGTGTQGGTSGKGNEHCAIFFSKERFELIETKTYWLTDTPEIKSELEGQAWPRIYTYVLLKDKTTGKRLVHLNTHLDTASSEIRVKEAELILEFLKKFNDVPVILSGDFNAARTTNELKTLFNAGFADASMMLDKEFYESKPYLEKGNIDYVIVTSDSLQITDYTVEGDRIFGYAASDHSAVYITFEFKELSGAINHGWNN